MTTHTPEAGDFSGWKRCAEIHVEENKRLEAENAKLRNALRAIVKSPIGTITAAPDLLAALEHFAAAYCPPDGSPLRWEACNEAYQHALAIIAKARGEG